MLLAVSDPNWFYSTLAQSTAAIVGLVGAFLIQRVLAIRADIAEDRLDARRTLERLMAEVVSVRKVCRRAIQELEEARAAITAGVEADAPHIEIPRAIYLPSSAGQVFVAKQALSSSTKVDAGRFQDRGEDLDLALTALTELRSWLPGSLQKCAKKVRTQGSIGSRDALTAEEREWRRQVSTRTGWELLRAQPMLCKANKNHLVRGSQGLGRSLGGIEERIALRSFWVLLGILTFLMAFGVIAPMFFLADRPDVPRGVLLGPFAVGSLALLGYYAFELYRLGTATDLSREHL